MVDGKVGIPKVGLQFFFIFFYFYYLKTLSHYVICKVLTFNFFYHQCCVGEESIRDGCKKVLRNLRL